MFTNLSPFLYSTHVISYSICLSLSNLFNLAEYPPGSSMLLQWQKFILFMAEKYSTACTYCFFFIHSSLDEHLSYFHFLAIVSNAGICIFELVLLWAFLDKYPRSGITGSYGRSFFFFLATLRRIEFLGPGIRSKPQL